MISIIIFKKEKLMCKVMVESENILDQNSILIIDP